MRKLKFERETEISHIEATTMLLKSRKDLADFGVAIGRIDLFLPLKN